MPNNTISRLFHRVREHWSRDGGHREFIAVAVPLILSTGAWSVQHFIDRMFLTWYSPAAIAAAMPAGMLNFMVMSVFLGTVSYTGTFVAQYFGARRYEMIGPSIWQGLYIAMAGGLTLAALIPFAGTIFSAVGHPPAVREMETVYFRILCTGAFPALGSAVLSEFYAGRGRTWPIMWVNAAGTLVNIVFDYLLIFGNLGFPRMGMAGAALATVLSGVATFGLYAALILRGNTERCRLLEWRPDRHLFRRMVRFGLPNGLQFSLDMAGFTVFVFFVGALGTVSLAATNIAINISTIAFMPMIGSGIASAVLVGQHLGADRPDTAERTVWSAFHLTFGYMLVASALFVLVPGVFLAPFAAGSDPGEFAAIRDLTSVLLRFVAVYSLFDAMNIIFSSAMRGAGDTHYIMRMLVVVSLFVLVVPSYLVLRVFGGGIYAGWTVASAYVAVLGLSFFRRFRTGPWKTMRVIEPVEPFVPTLYPEVPQKEV